MGALRSACPPPLRILIQRVAEVPMTDYLGVLENRGSHFFLPLFWDGPLGFLRLWCLKIDLRPVGFPQRTYPQAELWVGPLYKQWSATSRLDDPCIHNSIIMYNAP
jgi:hypothetical protein